MAERPLLKLPDSEPFTQRPRGGGGGSVMRPSRDRQRERLDPAFSRLARIAQDPQELMALRSDPAAIAPERAIVFEVEGSLSDFYAQVRAIGLEYLADYEEEIDPSSDFYDENKPDKKLSGRIYLAMPDVQALRELLSLWNRFKSGERMPRGRGPWRELFSQLIDVRAWGPQDRIPPDTVEAWREALAHAPSAPVRFEVELWYHEATARRAVAHQQLIAEIARAEGTIIDHAVIPEIHYDGLLVDVPADQVRVLLNNRDVGLARTDEVMFLRPQSMAQFPTTEPEGDDGAPSGPAPTFVSEEPIAALLDGLPVENHARLAGRLRVDDPDNLADTYPVARREHGTEMASLIIHGDLNQAVTPLPRPLYVRPVLEPTSGGGERTLNDRLLVDVIHQAVRRMKWARAARHRLRQRWSSSISPSATRIVPLPAR